MADNLSDPITQVLEHALTENGIGLLLLAEGDQLLHLNATAAHFFALKQGSVTIQQPFDASWLREHQVFLVNAHQQPFPIESLFLQSSHWLGIVKGNRTRWIKWQNQVCDWQGQRTRAVLLTDVTDLMSEKRALEREVASTSSRDTMTGLMNRRHALTQLQIWNKHAKRYGQGFSLALIDVDFFKRLNDTFGHRFGDEVILRVAKTLNGSVRETDMLARYGGEEFLLLMPGTALDDAILTLDRLRQQISELKWLGVAKPITVSIGVCDWEPHRSVEQLLFQTDQRLRTAKNAGRNQVCGDL